LRRIDASLYVASPLCDAAVARASRVDARAMASLLACVATPAMSCLGSCVGSSVCAAMPKSPPARATHAAMFACAVALTWALRDYGSETALERLSCACGGEARRGEARGERIWIEIRRGETTGTARTRATQSDARLTMRTIERGMRAQGSGRTDARARRGLRRRRCIERRARRRRSSSR
jgi:hypothetical protein